MDQVDRSLDGGRHTFRLCADANLLRKFPGTRIGVVFATHCRNNSKNARIDDVLRAEEKQQFERLKGVSLDNVSAVQAWRSVYQALGVDAAMYPSSIESLLSRVQKRGKISRISPIVDLYNYISLKYSVPMGAEDALRIQGDLELRFVHGTETGVFLGGSATETCPAGEVIYADAVGFVCRKWNWREAERTKIRPETTCAVFVIEALAGVSDEHLNGALQELRTLLEEQCSAQTQQVIVTDQNPCATFAYEQPREQKREAHHARQEAHHPSDEFRIRAAKVDRMRDAGIDPWPPAHQVTAKSSDINALFDTQPDGELSIAGRVMSIREHGKALFAVLQDPDGQVQMYLQEEVVGEQAYRQFRDFVDLGDQIWVKGTLFRTKTGVITVRARIWSMLSKSLYPMPDKFHGLADIEMKHRQRYLDLIADADTRLRFQRRSGIVAQIRTFLDSRGYREVETPMLHPIAGGAAARPFVTHHNALDDDFYLRIAPELYLKRLVVGGIERVYEINRNFRNEGVSTRHNPEFTMLELYTAHEDYHYAMKLVEQLLHDIAQSLYGTTRVPYGEHVIDYSMPFRRLSMREAIVEFGGFDANELAHEHIDALCVRHSLPAGEGVTYGAKIQALFEHVAERHLIQPTFIYDFPIEVSPLAKRDPANPDFAARFELFVAGMEISNAYNELNDPFDQAARFRQQLELSAAGDEEAHQYDADYILALEHALPPTVGIGIGIDRLTMLMTNTTSIKEVILFPTLKKKHATNA